MKEEIYKKDGEITKLGQEIAYSKKRIVYLRERKGAD